MQIYLTETLLRHLPFELLAGISKTDGGDAPTLLRAIRVTSYVPSGSSKVWLVLVTLYFFTGLERDDLSLTVTSYCKITPLASNGFSAYQKRIFD